MGHVIQAFATFYLLSYVKVLNATSDVLSSGILLTMNGQRNKAFFYYNASVPYFRGEHLPYAIFATAISILFNLLPLLLLCLYPCWCFHRCLNMTGCSWQALHIFMDAILGSYTHKPRERRYFGDIYLFLRLLHVSAFALLNPFTYLHAASYISILGIVLITTFRPYKTKWYNTLDLVFFSAVLHSSLMAIFYQAAVASDPRNLGNVRNNLYMINIYISASVMCIFGLGMLVRKILPRKFVHFIDVLHRKLQRTNGNKVEEPFERRRLPFQEVTCYNGTGHI